MDCKTTTLQRSPWLEGVKDALPLMGGYVPVAISFGLIATQSGFGIWETVAISILIYAGASQFLFIAMIASGAPWWLVLVMTLLINARHVVYGPNIAKYMSNSPWWIVLMHGLTDQIFALALTRFPQLAPNERMGWYIGAGLMAWMSWISGTAMGAIAGEELIGRFPLLETVLPFALPALFLVLLAPRFNSRLWLITLAGTSIVALTIKLFGFNNAAIPLAACCGALLYYATKHRQDKRSLSHE
ncbi:AzlC family ABC transporter permease [Vibrio sp. SCSIO 43136]|uniref:AzlC family ABC transporter permease n=1 Tax=Vibrio sp. SCSIO 43136 TaxID=2819101 RepID=UPI0020763785|nr:AzlC family ABC transporter permease [Vibrio sp. SCSIO 43136]USD66289.1 AzlC family ABC transporter permease [Vibrio sp. SCSIO 43136]